MKAEELKDVARQKNVLMYPNLHWHDEALVEKFKRKEKEKQKGKQKLGDRK